MTLAQALFEVYFVTPPPLALCGQVRPQGLKSSLKSTFYPACHTITYSPRMASRAVGIIQTCHASLHYTIATSADVRPLPGPSMAQTISCDPSRRAPTPSMAQTRTLAQSPSFQMETGFLSDVVVHADAHIGNQSHVNFSVSISVWFSRVQCAKAGFDSQTEIKVISMVFSWRELLLVLGYYKFTFQCCSDILVPKTIILASLLVFRPDESIQLPLSGHRQKEGRSVAMILRNAEVV
ncbi:uncharacterized protein LACBIDRAFT_324326 [Laccaria bicolor S238N-H82]|uniref:Predicted protein n=1 Tax=Laccaria bicolor (strain S238N-H82 / ATCC MYA-4686) TaxID=486041 RepID=B0D1G2_LACBS|nr:uncharacterized protein LACBIDRAFT_324326 [Laccaria bicolor S238N-H82]EDR11993.1 predicted protein [Laccaria bicolor S238N-H82]|eukprot:XP_001877890.1 predicted protein [Laccaria bicolor S238N-H82]